MNTQRSTAARLLLGVLLASLALAPATADTSDFTLAKSVPNDVFLCVAGRHNPEREFLDKYTAEIFDAIVKAGIVDDALGILGLVLDSDDMAEVERVRERFTGLTGAVDWNDLLSREMVFAERFDWDTQPLRGNIYAGPPAILVMFRCDPQRAPEHYRGLSELLEAGVNEINKLAGKDVLKVEHSQKLGAELAGVRIFERPSLPPEIDVQMTDSGAEELAKLSANNVGRKIAIIFDGKLLSAPTIRARIGSGHAMITGSFSAELA
ncbi:MAG: hypothetical protein JXO22_15320, partial [Phycisphaerae bacterium]|nr:hypothetical protein [Phycisphaerae bacterium]